MDRRRRLVCWPRLLPLVAGVALTVLIAPNASALAISEIVSQVSEASYTDYVSTLLNAHDGFDRRYSTWHDTARDNIYDAFVDFGLQTSLVPFSYLGSTYYNVVGVLPGLITPDEYYMVGAHYDSVACPGADDNASGTAGVLEAARVLADDEFAASLMFVAFDREEQGLYGSRALAQSYASADRNLLGMVSLDMIGYNPAGEHHDAVSLYAGRRNLYQGVKLEMLDAFALWGDGVTAIDRGGLGQSDHQPFEDWGFASALVIEDAMYPVSSPSNPNYHTIRDSLDTPGYFDSLYASRITRATVGWLAAQGGQTPEPSTLVLFAAGVAALALRRRRGNQ